MWKKRELFTKDDVRIFLRKRLPITRWLPQYSLPFFLQDLLAGFTVSLTEIPQAIAYAEVAGLSSECGLYTCIISGIAYAVVGGCKDIKLGVTGIMSILMAPVVSTYGTAAAVLLAFLTGLTTFLLGVFNLELVIEYFSFPIIAGFTCAAAIEIASAQINDFFGISLKKGSFLETWTDIFRSSDGIKLWDTLLASLSLVLLICLKEMKRFGTFRYRDDWSRGRNVAGMVIFIVSTARNALIILVGTVIAYKLGKDAPFRLMGDVSGGSPTFGLPPFSSTKDGTTYSFGEIIAGLGPSVVLIPIIGILETVTVAKSFGSTDDPNQEIIALGIIDMLSSFINGMPVSSSFTRSAINNSSGVQTPLGGIFTALIMILAIGFLTPSFYYIPKAVVAAVVVGAMIYLLEVHAVVTMWKSKKKDLIPFFVTVVGGLAINLEYGTLIGIFINSLFILYPAARPKIVIVREKIPGHHGDVAVVKPLDNLSFPAAGNIRHRILNLEGENLTVVIDGEYVRNIDTTMARSFKTINTEMTSRGHQVIFWHFKPSVVQVCTGVDKHLVGRFKTGDLEDVIERRLDYP